MHQQHTQHSNPSLTQRIGELEQQLQALQHSQSFKARRRLGWVVGLTSVLFVMLVAGAAMSQQDGCSSAVPVCFNSGDPVSASAFNSNFAALADALDSKLSQTAEGDVDITGSLGMGMSVKTCSGSSGVSECSCDSGEVALGGGAQAPSNAVLKESRPRYSARDTWQVECTDFQGVSVACTSIRVVCAKVHEL